MKELPLPDPREMKAEAIAKQFGWVKRVSESQYEVHSQRLESEYDVLSTERGWYCSCPDHVYREQKCKHIRAVEQSFILRKIVAKEPIVIQPVGVSNCPSCGSERIATRGIRHNKAGDIQRWYCKGCGYWFTVNLGFERMRATPQAITSAMQLYFSGESLRSVQKFLRLQGVNVSHVAIYKWIGRYVGLMQKYLEQITPKVSDTWRADEMYVSSRAT